MRDRCVLRLSPLGMLRKLCIVSVLGLIDFVAGAQAQTVNITVHSYAGNGPANLVSNALPLKPGALSDARDVRVLDGATELRIATRVLATWPQDGSIRSLLLQFDVPTAKGYTIEIGSPRSTSDLTFRAVNWDLPTRIFTLPASYISQSLIFWEQTPLGQSGFPAWDSKQTSAYYRIENPGTAACVRDDQYYDAISTTFQLYARTGELRYLVNGRRWALHHRRDQIYLSGTSIGHPRCSGAYLNNTRYTFPQGLVSDYFMFGDEEARRVSGVVVDNFYMPHADSFYYKAPQTRGWWTEREPAFSLIGIMAHYEATGNSVYLNKVKERVTSLHRMQVDNSRRAWVHNLYDHDPSEGCGTSDYGSSPWMSGLLLEAIVRYHKMTADPIAKESILMAVDDIRARYVATGSHSGRSFVYLGCPAYRDGAPDLDNLIAHAFGYAYKLTGRSEYRDFGTSLFNTAVQYGVTGSHKHYNQQFRSSGHFPAYIAEVSSSDTAAPLVSITSPTAGQGVSGTLTVSASASDNVGVTGVQFLVDGQPLGAEDMAAPYALSLDSATLSSGSHSISARARDSAGNRTTCAGVNFNVLGGAVAPGLTDEMFVRQLYLDLLSREPDSGGLAYWVSILQSGQATRGQLAYQYFTSNEFQGYGMFVISAYRAVLGRDADFAGWILNLNNLRNGLPRQSLIEQLVLSPEFVSTYGSVDNAGFVRQVYLNVLGREPDAGGLSYWVGVLNGGTSRANVLYSFCANAEFQARIRNRALATLLYLGFLRRSPEPGGAAYWTSVLDAGVAPAGILNAFITSTEYLARF